MLKVSDEDVWYWHTHCEKQMESGLGITAYSRQFGVDYKRFSNMRYRVIYKKYSDPETYKILMNQAVQFMNSGKSVSKYCDEKKANKSQLKEALTHLRYLDEIERISKEKQPETKMNFVQIAPQPQAIQPHMEPEILEKQNDIEIIITKGVKVSISPNIDSMKIIKIIELLKDL